MRKYHARSLTTAGILLLVLTLILPAIPYLWISATANDTTAAETAQRNPGVDFWHSVRGGESGSSVVSGSEAAVFINSNGQTWRHYRINILAPYGSYLMAAVLTVVALFFLLRGPIQLQNGASGQLVLRFSINQRVIHWFTAILFWLLALTGLILLYGRFVLIPLLGAKGFAITASACKEAHNLFGPLFLAALLMLFIAFVRGNFYAKGDLIWLAKGGGMLAKHVSAGKFNFGEKIWFWLVCLFGLIVSISGLVLDFPTLGQGRGAIELAHVLHTATAIVFIAVSFGHIYLGTIGTQGTLRGMTTGYVDANWAKHHHDRWLSESGESGEPGDPVVSENQQTDSGQA
jgi:formate dehydrogenase subunit gamma